MQNYILQGQHVSIIRNKKTGHSRGYGFMTFETHEAAERILHLYNGSKIMPGTMNRFCLNWAFSRFKGRPSQYKSSGSTKSSNYQRRAPDQIVNNMKQVQSSNLSLSTTADIPLDVIENILLRLPAKSIVRHRTTCKAWTSLTSTPTFIYQHLKNRKSLSDPIFVIGSTIEQANTCFSSNYSMEAICSFRTMEFEFPSGFSQTMTPYAVSNTCNGLVCVYRSFSNNDFASVVNPSIRETIQLPESSMFLTRSVPRCICSIGIGYDHFSDTYKIVRMFKKQETIMFGSTGVEYEVITLGGRNCHWRYLGYIRYHVATGRPPVFLHDTIYWLMSMRLPHSLTDVILSFNVRTETVHMFPVPEVRQISSLLVLGECLCILSEDAAWGSNANLYVLEDNKWVKKHTIEYNPIGRFSNPIANCEGKIFFTSIFPSLFSIWTANRDLFAEYYYDTKSGGFGKTATLLRSSESFIRSDTIRGCAESLVSPIFYLQKSNSPCPVFHIFGQRWATLYPTNSFSVSF